MTTAAERIANANAEQAEARAARAKLDVEERAARVQSDQRIRDERAKAAKNAGKLGDVGTVAGQIGLGIAVWELGKGLVNSVITTPNDIRAGYHKGEQRGDRAEAGANYSEVDLRRSRAALGQYDVNGARISNEDQAGQNPDGSPIYVTSRPVASALGRNTTVTETRVGDGRRQDVYLEGGSQAPVYSAPSAGGQSSSYQEVYVLMARATLLSGPAQKDALAEAKQLAHALPKDQFGYVIEPVGRDSKGEVRADISGRPISYKFTAGDNRTPDDLLYHMGAVVSRQLDRDTISRGAIQNVSAPAAGAAGTAVSGAGEVGNGKELSEQKLVGGVVSLLQRAEAAKEAGNEDTFNKLVKLIPAAAHVGNRDGMHDLKAFQVPNKGGTPITVIGGDYTPADLTKTIMREMGVSSDVVNAVSAKMGIPVGGTAKRMSATLPDAPAPAVAPATAPAVAPAAAPAVAQASVAAAPAVAPAAAPAAEQLPAIELKRGGTERVGKVQQTLESLGFATDVGGANDGKVDGIAADKTKTAVRKVEEILIKAGKLDGKADGIIDDKFIAALEAAKADPKLKALLEEASGKKTAAAPAAPAVTAAAPAAAPTQAEGLAPGELPNATNQHKFAAAPAAPAVVAAPAQKESGQVAQRGGTSVEVTPEFNAAGAQLAASLAHIPLGSREEMSAPFVAPTSVPAVLNGVQYNSFGVAETPASLAEEGITLRSAAPSAAPASFFMSAFTPSDAPAAATPAPSPEMEAALAKLHAAAPVAEREGSQSTPDARTPQQRAARSGGLTT